MRKHALYKVLVFLCLRPMEMFLNKMAYLKSQGSIKDFQMLIFLVFPCHIYIYKKNNNFCFSSSPNRIITGFALHLHFH